MNYRRKYLKYKKKYLFYKLFGGNDKCIYISAHGSEIKDSINLNDNQMTIMYYKPGCTLYIDTFTGNKMLNIVSNINCNQSNYRKLVIIFDENIYPTSATGTFSNIIYFSVFSGNKQDVEFFKYLLYDSNLRINNDISIVPNIEFYFYDEYNEPLYMVSFPIEYVVSSKPKAIVDIDVKRIINESRTKKDIDRAKLYISDKTIFVTSDEEASKYISEKDLSIVSNTLTLKDILKFGSFIWIYSCREAGYQMSDSDLKIGVPLIIFMLYSIYNIVMEIVGKVDNYDNIRNKFMTETHDLFKKIEYSHDHINFTMKYIQILKITLIEILENSDFKIEINDFIVGMHSDIETQKRSLYDILSKFNDNNKDKINDDDKIIISHCMRYVDSLSHVLEKQERIILDTEERIFGVVLFYFVDIGIDKKILYDKLGVKSYLDNYKFYISFSTLITNLLNNRLSNEEKKLVKDIYKIDKIRNHINAILKSLKRLNDFYVSLYQTWKESKKNFSYIYYILSFDKFISVKCIEYGNIKEIYDIIFNANPLFYSDMHQTCINTFVIEFYKSYNDLIQLIESVLVKRKILVFTNDYKKRINININNNEYLKIKQCLFNTLNDFRISNSDFFKNVKDIDNSNISILVYIEIFIRCTPIIIEILSNKGVQTVLFEN